MKFFNIISESKSFLLLLLFAFTLVTTTQSFASSKNDGDDLAKLCGKDADLTKLEGENKEKCETWCADKANWHDKCLTDLGIKQPAGGNEAPNEMKTDGATNALSMLTDAEASKITPPAEITNMYKVDFTIDKTLRAKLFDAYKAKSTTTTSTLQAKDLYNLENQDAPTTGVLAPDLNAIDTEALSKKLITYITSPPKDVAKPTAVEKIFATFRNNWLGFEGKGSLSDNETDFEPYAFKTLAASENSANQSNAHKIYNMFFTSNDEQIFKNVNATVTEKTEIDAALKKLQDALLAFVNTAIVVTIASDTWAPNTNLTFSVQLGKPTPKQDEILGLDVSFDPNNKDHFDKIKHIFIPVNFGTGTGVDEAAIKLMALHGLLVLSGGILDPTINPDSTETDPLKNKFTPEEKGRIQNRIYAVRLKDLETKIKEKVAAGAPTLATTIVDGSLLDNIVKFVKLAGADNPAGNAFNQAVGANLLALGPMNTQGQGTSRAVADRTIQKIGVVGNKWLVLISSVTGTNKNLIGFLTEPLTEPRFITTAVTPFQGSVFTNSTHIFPQINSGIVSEENMFADANVITNAIVNVIVHNGASDVHTVGPNANSKHVKFRFRNTHGFGNRAGGVVAQDNGFLTALRAFNRCFLTDLLGFGTDAPASKKMFDELTKLSPALAQLYAYNKFTHQISLADNQIFMLPGAGGGGEWSIPGVGSNFINHYLSTHVVDPNTNLDDITLILTSKLRQ